MPTKPSSTVVVLLTALALLAACSGSEAPAADSGPAQAGVVNVSQPSPQSIAQLAQPTAAPTTVNTSAQAGAVALDPGKGSEIGFVYEAFLSPQQEPGEEKDTPALTPKEFLSTAPSLLRNERKSRGHGTLRITNDLSKAYVDVKVEGVSVQDVIMFHIHCGRPDTLGPILIDFALGGNIQENLADGTFSTVVTNEDIEKEAAAGHGLVGAFTAGCPVVPGVPGNVKTIASMQYIAERGELYFNLHTKGQTFYGDMRGQLHPVAGR